MVWILSKPVYPEKFHSLGLCVIGYPHIDVIYAKHLCIPVWMRIRICVVLVSQNHDKGMSVDVDRILSMTHVICCVIDPKNVMAVHVIAQEYHGLLICVRKSMFVTIIWNIVIVGQ
jgi:hypothetical protein